MFKRLFTARAVDTECRKRLLALTDHVEELRKYAEKLKDALEELHSEHRKLRGRFYAARGEIETPAQPQSKAEILRSIGYVPGRAPPHRS
jgi:predicted  nucleic acid-binding Zn-ribbon protein